ncbi:peptidylprolyl isomerase [Phenylobacterium immobile]|uniref:peptidylprolyl isomerase n=1 Tax=Phenylobacterium immobile TaxID=21 RepID=UPI001FE043B8|nr:peptidylprolyl isomerase [Phenylobacterium immobile]
MKLSTPSGDIVLELADTQAPLTARNFLKYVDDGLFDGSAFYRASRPRGETGTNFGFVQGGLQNDPARVLPPIAHESTAVTGLRNVDGAITMARYAPGTAQADWIICVGDQLYLDATPSDPKTTGFAVFGRVIAGMEVVRSILGMPVDLNAGEGPMKGQMLLQPLTITSARRVE